MPVGPGVTGLVGANGAGKSTLIKILLGLLPPTSGRAAVLGLDCDRDGARIRALSGYMPEHDCLPPDISATEFVTHMGRMSGLPPTAAKERAADSLRHVGLYEERYRQIGTYSTGMKQRVKLAQALVGRPAAAAARRAHQRPGSGGPHRDAGPDRRIGTEFGISIVVASHLLGEIEQICDHLVAIDGGRLLRADTISSITQVSQVLLVEVEEGTAQLAAELATRGLRPLREQRGLLVQLAGDETYDVVRDAVADLGLPLNRMEQRRHRIEELFRDTPDREEQRDHAEQAAGGPDRCHPRHRLPVLRGAAPGPRRHRPGPDLAQPAVGLRPRPRRQGQDHPGADLRDHVPARGGQRHRAGHARRPGGRLRHLRAGPRILVLMAFIAAQAPELVSRDLRSHTLPLYFARPIHRIDYPAAKLAAFFLACLIMIEVPLLLLYIGTVTQVHGGSAVWAQTRALIPGLLLGVAWAAVLPRSGLLLASFSGRRAYATGGVAIVLFLTYTLAGLLLHIGERGGGRRGGAAGRPDQPVHGAGRAAAVARRDHARADPPPGSFGPAYGVMFLIFLAVAVGGLIVRYRRVGVA